VAESTEIDELRAQLKSLEERVSRRPRATNKREAPEPEKAASSPFDGASAVLEQAKEIAKEWHLPEASEKLGEFLAALGDDIKESPPRALIAAFLAGFVAGKLVSR
jgi:F0F1-type ATP synthase assembly protein I